MGMIGKVCWKAAKDLIVIGGVLYINYRLAGGPPLRKVYKEIRQKNREMEIRKAKEEGNVIQAEDGSVV